MAAYMFPPRATTDACRSISTSSPVRCAVLVQGGAVLTGHDDGMVRAWMRDGSSSWKETDNARWKVEIKMHNTAVCCLIPSRTGSVWTASSAGSVRQIGLDGARTDVEAKAPASKSAHSTAINAAVVTRADLLWTGARHVKIWTATGEWRQSIQDHPGKVLSMAVAGACVWVGFSDGRLRLFHEDTAACLAQLQDDGRQAPITSLVPTPYHMWTGTADGHVKCFAQQSHRLLLEAPVFAKSGAFALAPTFRCVWVGGEKGVVVALPRPRESDALPQDVEAVDGPGVSDGFGQSVSVPSDETSWYYLQQREILLREDLAEIDGWLLRPMSERALTALAIAADATNFATQSDALASAKKQSSSQSVESVVQEKKRDTLTSIFGGGSREASSRSSLEYRTASSRSPSPSSSPSPSRSQTTLTRGSTSPSLVKEKEKEKEKESSEALAALQSQASPADTHTHIAAARARTHTHASGAAVQLKPHAARITVLLAVPAADGCGGGSGSGVFLWTAAQGEKHAQVWGPFADHLHPAEAEWGVDELQTVGVEEMDTSQYIARPLIIHKLKTALFEAGESERVALVGQRGSGKSTLARCLLHHVIQSHKSLKSDKSLKSEKATRAVRIVFLLSGRDSGDMARGYRELMHILSRVLARGPPANSASPADSPSGNETEEEVRAFVHSALRDRALKHRWLAVIHDLPSPCEPALEEAGLSWLLATDAGGFPWGSGKTLVTSRFHGWKETFGGVGEVVGAFEEEEALALLADKVEHWRDDAAGIKDVARRLAYFPLALASAAGCAKAYSFKPHEYLAELEERCRSDTHLLQACSSRAKTSAEYPYEFFEAMHVTWHRLAEGRQGETVTELLRKLAFVDPYQIPVTLFEHLRHHLPILTEHGLVTVSAAGAHVSMHALTQLVLREHLMVRHLMDHALASATAQVRARMDEFKPGEHGTFAAATRYAPHAKAVLSHLDAPASVDVAELALQLGHFYRAVAFSFDDARRMFERSLSVWRVLGKDEHSLEVATCYNALGMVCDALGKYAEATSHYERSFAIYIQVHGTEEHANVATSLNNLGLVLEAQGRYAEAAQHLERSLAIYIKVHGTEEHPEVAGSLNNLGTVLQAMGRHAEAAQHLERSLAIIIKVHGTEEHPEVAGSLSNLGAVLQDMGRYAEAAQHLERSLAIGIKVHGTEEHPYVATILNNLGFVLQAMGRHEEAAKHYERSLAIRLKVHGTEEHPGVAGSLSGLGFVLQAMGRHEEAAKHYERSLAIYNKVHNGLHGTDHANEEHPDVARSRRNLQSLHDLVSASNARPRFRNTHRWLHVGITIFLSLFCFCVFLSFLFFSYVMLSFGEVGDKSCSAGPAEPKDVRARLTGFLGGNGGYYRGQEKREKDKPSSRKEKRK